MNRRPSRSQTASYPAGTWRAAHGGLPRSEAAQDAAIVLPLYHQMTDDEQARVVTALRNAVSAS